MVLCSEPHIPFAAAYTNLLDDMQHINKLTALGFKPVPGLDPKYFALRNAAGYYVLFNQELGSYYQLYTVNASECTRSIKEVIDGRKRQRAVSLLDTLRGTVEEDWIAYFKPCSQIKNFASRIVSAMNGYVEIRKGTQRLNPKERINLHSVEFEGCEFTRIAMNPLGDGTEEIVSEYLRLWRKTLDAGLKSGTLGLVQYYKGSAYQAKALEEFIKGDYSSFAICALFEGTALTREQGRIVTSKANKAHTQAYFEKLFNLPPIRKERLVFKDVPH